MIGRCGVPADATAVAVTVTATQGETAGFLTTWPAGQPLPNASTVNYGRLEDRANGAIVRLGADGAIDVRASVPTHIIVDVTGWFGPAAVGDSGQVRTDRRPACLRQPLAELRAATRRRRVDRRAPCRGACLPTPSRWRSTSPRPAPTHRGTSPPIPPAHRCRRRRCSTPSGPARPAPRRASCPSRKTG